MARHYLGKDSDLYAEIKSGKKTVEWRHATDFWLSRLCHESRGYSYMVRRGRMKTLRYTTVHLKSVIALHRYSELNLTSLLKVKTAWFMVGFPKGNVPRLEATIWKLVRFPSGKLGIYFKDVKEKK